MDKQTVASLRRLHDQLQELDPLSEHDRPFVEQLRTDIQSLLDQAEAGSAHEPHTVREQLEVAIQRFEVSHPDLTAVMAGVVDSLASIGI